MIDGLRVEYQSSDDKTHITFVRKTGSVTGLIFLLKELRSGRYKADIYQCVIDDEILNIDYKPEYTIVHPYKTIIGTKHVVEMRVLDLCGVWYNKPESDILKDFEITLH